MLLCNYVFVTAASSSFSVSLLRRYCILPLHLPARRPPPPPPPCHRCHHPPCALLLVAVSSCVGDEEGLEGRHSSGSGYCQSQRGRRS